MKIVEEGDKVSIEFEAKLENGENCFPKNKENTVELVVGEGQFFPMLEDGLLKMKEGEKKKMTLEPNDAFGPHLNDLVMDAPRSAFRPDFEPVVGMRMKIDAPSGKVFYGTITGINKDAITLDLNHPLAGKKIVFTITIIAIQKK
ncbi:MAG: FKBP-type peptidyl-prolyl cis-trans isomerase [Thermoplasmatales archaeon]|nr:MAG: FKBP-type peptidyl-prolyl cis-trans isomerase [Thermoplasmatales archaeon]